MKNSTYHTPVLLKETIEALEIKKGNKYIDCTLGGGGHSQQILSLGGIVLGIDQDQDAIDESNKRFDNDPNITIVKGNFSEIVRLANLNDFEICSGILFDLGTSSHQLNKRERGFSFQGHELLDMRMDQSATLSASEIVNKWGKQDLLDIFEKYGEETEAKAIVAAIIDARKTKKIEFADDFAELVAKVKKVKDVRIHPATKVFQALRIAVNNELGVLKEALESSIQLLESGGRIAVITFHSLEDRIVKNTFVEFEKKYMGKIINKKTVTASFAEVSKNKRARSARLRVFEKIQ